MPMVLMTITKEAAKLIKTGQAVFSSGGVRSLAGSLVELAKPLFHSGKTALAFSSVSGNATLGAVMAGVDLASSLGNNVQSAFIQKGLNEANFKLDKVLTQLESIATSMNAISTINVLSWANLALNLANCGISIAGFKMTLDRLGGLSFKLDEFYDRYKQDQLMELAEEYDASRQNLISDIDVLSRMEANRETILTEFKRIEQSINAHLIQAKAFLEKKLMPKFQARTIDGKTGCEMVFTLSELYAQVLNAYIALSYYAYHQMPRLTGEWVGTIKLLEGPEFRDALKQNLFLDPAFATIDPDRKYDAMKVSLEGIRECSGRLEKCAEALPRLSLDEYLKLDDAESLCVTTALVDAFPSLQDGKLDEMMTEALKNNTYTEQGDTVLIPLALGA